MKRTVSTAPKKKVIRTAAVPSSLYSLLKGQLQFLNQHYEIIGLASKGPLLKKMEEREGIRSIAVNIERNISPLKDLISLYRLYMVFRKEKPFIVHSITPKAGLLSMMAAYFARVPKRAHTFTGLIFPTQTGVMKKLLLFFDTLICRFATHIYPEGNGVKNDLLAYKVTKKPLHIIANGNVNGVNLEHLDPSIFSSEDILHLRKTLHISPTDMVLVYIGRLVNDKGVNELVHAFCSLVQKHSEVKLVLVGSHEGETDLLPAATWDKINAQPHIIGVGHQDDVRPFLAMCDAFVFPSYREGFPNVVLEAGAMGKPAIVTDINGSNEIIVHGKNGYIIPSKDEHALLQAMTLFVENPQMVQTMAEHARPMIAKHYEQSYVWEAILKEYERIEDGEK